MDMDSRTTYAHPWLRSMYLALRNQGLDEEEAHRAVEVATYRALGHTLKDISVTMGVAEKSIRNANKSLRKYLEASRG